MRAELASDGVLIANEVKEAKSFMARLRGLMYKKDLPSGEALLIKPCDSIHTFGMRFAIDVLFIDSAGTILRAVHSLKPGKVIGPVRKAIAVLEMISGSLPGEIELEGKTVRFSS